jgi:hypothetical protein
VKDKVQKRWRSGWKVDKDQGTKALNIFQCFGFYLFFILPKIPSVSYMLGSYVPQGETTAGFNKGAA